MKYPEHIRLANLPTKIEKLENLSKELGKNIYIKRDDQTGTEVSGNKVRKLEFGLKEALNQGCDTLITVGGIQSNHCRATAAVAAKFGLASYLILNALEPDDYEGNVFLDKILGANIVFMQSDEYKDKTLEVIVEELMEKLSAQGHKGYFIPAGASNAIGSFGYITTIDEILDQEKEMGIKFDAIVSTTGSTGTYSGLYYGNKVNNNDANIIGISISQPAENLKPKIIGIFDEIAGYTGEKIEVTAEEIWIIEGYAGLGYAISQQHEIDFIKNFASTEGIVLDPVYTGKAMYGLVEEIKKGTFDKHENILFIHTGGIYGWTKTARAMVK